MIVISCLYDNFPLHDEIREALLEAVRPGERIQPSNSIPELKHYSTLTEVEFIVLGPDCCSWDYILKWDTLPSGDVPVIHYRDGLKATTDMSGNPYEGPGVTVVHTLDELRRALGLVASDDDIAAAIASITTTIQSREA